MRRYEQGTKNDDFKTYQKNQKSFVDAYFQIGLEQTWKTWNAQQLLDVSLCLFT